MTSLPSSASGPYSGRDVRSLYPRVTETHLRYLEKWGLLRVAASRDERAYSFADLATIKAVAAELEKGTPMRVILRTLSAEREGQLALDFGHTDAQPAKVVTLAPKKPRQMESPSRINPGPLASKDADLQGFPFTDPQAALAAKYFIEGSRLDDGEEDKMEDAAQAYRKALVIDPDLVPAVVNLANIHYARDEMIEAQALYERAITLDPDCFEAHYNLGNIHHDLGRFPDALACYRNAVALNGSYPDAHFYLAVTLEKTGHSPEAKPHWKLYQELAPNGEWIELAREFTD